MKAQGIIDELERQFIDRGGISARGGGEFGGLTIGQEDLGAVGHRRLAIDNTLFAV